MVKQKQFPLEINLLGNTSSLFAVRLFEHLPALESYATMVKSVNEETFDLFLEMSSPTGDEDRNLTIWIDESDEPSVGFGTWHTHASVWQVGTDHPDDIDAIIDLVGAILNDEFVLIKDVGGEYDGHTGIIDLRQKDSLAEELTSRYSPGKVKVLSWTGARDSEIGLDNLVTE